MLDVLKRLSLISRRGGLPLKTEGGADWYHVTLFEPAGEEAILAAAAALGRRIPEQLVEFWRFSNGANLFLNESGLHGVGLASTDLIQQLQIEEARFYGASALASYLVLGRVHGSGDFIVVELSSGRILDGVHAEQPHEWREIAPDLHAWLLRLVNESGRYFWLEDLMRDTAV